MSRRQGTTGGGATPLPWSGHHQPGNDVAVIKDARGEEVGTAYSEAAELIIRSVNVVPVLVAALEAALVALASDPDEEPVPQIRHALAWAKGGGS